MPGRAARPRWPSTWSRLPGSPRVSDAHYPPAPPGALGRTPKARTAAEAQFLAIGDGAGLWLAEAAAAGAARVRAKMAQAVRLAALHGAGVVDQALGQAATAGRFAEPDLAAIIAHQATAGVGPDCQAGEQRTLAQGTGGVGTARPDGGNPMTLRAPHQDARLTSEEIEVIRSTLTGCSQVLYWAARHGWRPAGPRGAGPGRPGRRRWPHRRAPAV